MTPPRTITITDILTDAEIEQAFALYQEAAPGTFNKRLVPLLIEPNLKRINKALGQENDPVWLGYAVEWVFHQNTQNARRKK